MSIGTLLAACTNAAERGDSVHFLRWRTPTEGVELALTEGTLVLEASCLRLQPRSGGTDYALIWPLEFGFKAEGNTVTILGVGGQRVAKVGDVLEVGGGDYGELTAEEFERFVIGSPRCGGPYWRVGGVEVTASKP
ncbi:hypothetical protein [Truepera radiovictrix]|uniref:hypothetical protein n=1 Tax=Truepera radiovictrix TaxID=332249 RepID=UPI0002E7BCBF|nr:hypothetical protein [Truepera radiovictrix]